ncbi:recombinase family protein [Paenibacillus sp. KN14-4R]|uniref:recombinase family protein n=1 Tax=Paenibacillus sp. KN14-4R TaxID=3445773 RepID=UPI003F9F7986
MNHIAAIYVRVSTTKDSQKDSPEHQRGICKEKARALGLEVGYTYEDRDTGTSIVARPEIQKLVRDAQNRLFQIIIFASLSRFSRDTLDSLSLKRKLADALGIRVISIEEGYDSFLDNDELKFQIISAVNQKLSEQISLSSKRGIRQSARSGNFTGSIPPYGYQKVMKDRKKTLIPDPDTAHVVRLIYSLYIDRKIGEKAIVTFLNERHIPAYKGGAWGLTSVQKILTNEVYAGQNVFSKYEIEKIYHNLDDVSDRGKKQVRRNPDKWERSAERTHEAIVDETTFLAAQQVRLQRGGGTRGGIRNKVNVFAGFIFCTHCGGAMVSMKSGSYRYLICSRRRRQGERGCVNNFWLPYEAFRDQVLEVVSSRLRALVDPKSFVEMNAKQVTSVRNDPEMEIRKVQRKLEVVRKTLYGMRKLYLNGQVDEEQYAYEKQQYEADIEACQFRLIQLQQQNEQQINPDACYAIAETAVEEWINLKFRADFERLRAAIQRLIDKIEVPHTGQIVITTILAD